MKGQDGQWHGISIELWRQIAENLQLQYEFREYDLPGLLGALEKGTIDAGVAALTITAKREEKFEKQHYGIGLPAGSQLREPINRQTLSIINQPEWKDILYKYLGNFNTQ